MISFTRSSSSASSHEPDAGWLVQSDNRNKQAWPTVPWPAEASIVGEVKWVARSFV